MNLSPSPPPRPLSDADVSPLWGALLIGIGLLFLFRQLVPATISDLAIGALMVAGGAFFLNAYRRDRASWALLIPGVALLAIGIGRMISSVAPRLGDGVSGALLTGSLGVAFLVAYSAERRQRWWAIIPAGALLGLAAGNIVQGLGGSASGWLFVGLGSAFLWLALRTDRTWGFWPAAVLLFIGLNDMRGLFGLDWPGFGHLRFAVWPVALIVIGLWLLVGRRTIKE